jgi:hypothetical protein
MAVAISISGSSYWCNHPSADEPQRGFLHNAAARLGIAAELPLTEKARRARDEDLAACRQPRKDC